MRQTDGAELFWLDAKLSPAQGYQFVVRFVDGCFQFSAENKTIPNKYSSKIIEHMNRNIDTYTNPGTAGYDVFCDEELITNWIISQCEAKNVKFIVTSTQLDSFKAIIPVRQIPEFFSITARYRVKRSGSRDVAIKYRSSALKQLSLHLEEIGLNINNSYVDGKRTLAHIDSQDLLVGENLYFGENYYLSARRDNEGEYLIKQRGSTRNANIIFVLKYRGPQENLGIDELHQSIVSII